uniref:Uncharacterized protein n=1 Tax=Oryza brachyantha TaxID=4533 RepID=J3LGR6_ORYBR
AIKLRIDLIALTQIFPLLISFAEPFPPLLSPSPSPKAKTPPRHFLLFIYYTTPISHLEFWKHRFDPSRPFP